MACKDIGIDCSFVVKGKSEEKLMAKATKHLSKKHQIATLTPDLVAKAKAAVKKAA